MSANATSRKDLIKENKRLGYYNIKVIDKYTNKIKERLISHEQKDRYLKEFGDKMLDDNAFFEWWYRTLHYE
jgi:hypothetical protein